MSLKSAINLRNCNNKKLGTLIKNISDYDLTKIIIVKYFQNYIHFWIFVNLKLKFACIKLSLHFFQDTLYIFKYTQLVVVPHLKSHLSIYNITLVEIESFTCWSHYIP